MISDVTASLNKIRQNIQNSCMRVQRPADQVQLVAVSKQQPMDKIYAALDAGQRLFGENRVQEAEQHWAPIRAQYPDLQLHLIGPLQTNKVRSAVALFDVIETIDRPALVDAVAREIEAQGKALFCLVQVNIGREPQKSGVDPDELPALLSYCDKAGLVIDGLMCIPPFAEDPRFYFQQLRDLADTHGLWQLSMGMSSDYEIAIEEGATFVRVGSALFGDRD